VCGRCGAGLCAEHVIESDLSQPTVSHHLRVLRDAGVLECERQGLWSYYYVLPEALDELAAWLDTHFTEVADADRAVHLSA
jgi:Predicted transcriptional regulators